MRISDCECGLRIVTKISFRITELNHPFYLINRELKHIERHRYDDAKTNYFKYIVISNLVVYYQLGNLVQHKKLMTWKRSH